MLNNNRSEKRENKEILSKKISNNKSVENPIVTYELANDERMGILANFIIDRILRDYKIKELKA